MINYYLQTQSKQTQQQKLCNHPLQSGSCMFLTPLEDKNRKEILYTIKNVMNLLFPQRFRILLRMKETLQYM